MLYGVSSYPLPSPPFFWGVVPIHLMHLSLIEAGFIGWLWPFFRLLMFSMCCSTVASAEFFCPFCSLFFFLLSLWFFQLPHTKTPSVPLHSSSSSSSWRSLKEGTRDNHACADFSTFSARMATERNKQKRRPRGLFVSSVLFLSHLSLGVLCEWVCLRRCSMHDASLLV